MFLDVRTVVFAKVRVARSLNKWVLSRVTYADDSELILLGNPGFDRSGTRSYVLSEINSLYHFDSIYVDSMDEMILRRGRRTYMKIAMSTQNQGSYLNRSGHDLRPGLLP